MSLLESLKKSNILVKPVAKNRWDIIGEMIDLAVKNKESEVKDKIYELTTKLNNLESEKKQLVENFDLQKKLIDKQYNKRN